MRNLKTIAGEEAKDLQLSIDLELQRQAASQIGDRAGSVILSDITTGEILVAYSSPNLNSNLLSSGDNSYWAHINQDESIPLINRLTRGLYSPASAFKVVVALAALEAGIDPNARFYCSGEIQIGNRVFHCLKKSGHGHVNCQEAIASSCNIYVWELALRVGFDRIEQMARKLGFGSSVGLFNDEKTGLLPTREWKKKQYQQSWLLGDTVNFAIGQGYLLSTPLQLWRMISLIAGRGNFVEPSLTKVGTGDIAPKPINIISLNTKSFDAVHQGMVAGVNKPYGTSYRFSLHNPKWQVAGKTGTVQIVSKRDAGPNHAVFVGYAPAHKPRYATSIVVEKSGYGGKVAAPIALGLFRMLMNRNT
ncbi:MAG: penicillin-binding transpeptidase domain-containing protein [Pseudomonadota bacterium]